MDSEIRDRIIMMLKSGDDEMRSLAIIVFCQQSPSFMEYFYIERTLKYGSWYYDDRIKPFLKKMSRCVK